MCVYAKEERERAGERDREGEREGGSSREREGGRERERERERKCLNVAWRFMDANRTQNTCFTWGSKVTATCAR